MWSLIQAAGWPIWLLIFSSIVELEVSERLDGDGGGGAGGSANGCGLVHGVFPGL